jgi:hypothetical protein
VRDSGKRPAPPRAAHAGRRWRRRRRQCRSGSGLENGRSIDALHDHGVQDRHCNRPWRGLEPRSMTAMMHAPMPRCMAGLGRCLASRGGGGRPPRKDGGGRSLGTKTGIRETLDNGREKGRGQGEGTRGRDKGKDKEGTYGSGSTLKAAARTEECAMGAGAGMGMEVGATTLRLPQRPTTLVRLPAGPPSPPSGRLSGRKVIAPCWGPRFIKRT